jgi:membrane dipeptidase
MFRSLISAVFLLTSAQNPAPFFAPETALVAKAKGIHDRVLKLDTHNDIEPAYFTRACNYTMRLTTQVNLPKMTEGDMDVAFLIVYTGQGALTAQGYEAAYKEALAKFNAVHRLTETIAPDKIRLALSPAEVESLHAKGLRVAVIGIENGYSIGTDIKRVQEFYDRGARYMSLAHNGNSQLADSNTGEAQGYIHDNGLSALGRQVIAEMNRLGMMIDLSHPSKGANLEMLRLSKAPVIASHSSARALANASRNMDDEQLLALKKNGGVIQIVAFPSYLRSDPPERAAALTKLRQAFGVSAVGRVGGGSGSGACPLEDARATQAPQAAATGMNASIAALSPDKRAEYNKRLAEIDAKWPGAGRAAVKDLVNHIDYVVKLIGIDHVGISSDFDGGGGIDGWNSAADAFNVTLELVRRGYSEPDIAKLWGGNLLRVWRDVENVAKDLQKK